MCGIFGIVAQNAAVPAGVLERGTQSLAHRGPDDSGTILLRDSAPVPTEIGLGNRRLAILDLSPLAHQPMHDAETRNWIVYNGEIYNFREIRSELETLGKTFVSHSDTEVLLKAYAQWGRDCLAKLRGMFAFAIWDANQHLLFAARDPMGIKPLYYAQTGSLFLFASEVRTLLGTGILPRRLDHAGLINYLTFGSAYDPLTLIDGIQSVRPGHGLIWHAGSIREFRYWDLVDLDSSANEDSAKNSTNGSGAGSKLQAALEQAVRMQLVSDVPVGVFLSGGIDSSALVSILSRGGITPSTFSIVFREAEFSEAPYSRLIASTFRTDHHEITVSQADVLAAIPDAVQAMDLPTMDGINTYFVSREARRAGVKVALSGLGGDELFAGYSSFRTVPKMERFAHLWRNMPKYPAQAAARTFASLARSSDQNRKISSLLLASDAVLHPYFLSRMLFDPQLRDQLIPGASALTVEKAIESQQDILNRSRFLDPINRVSYLESRCYMLNTLLRDSDFMSMSQGLELRVPLIDHILAKEVLSLPGKSKINGAPKKLLLAALQKSLPDKIVHRKKHGFTLPFERWMRQELQQEVQPALDEKTIDDGPLGGILSGKAVRAIWSSFMEGTVSWTRPWSLYVLQRWCELHT
ncbi:MAG TPA: asparagine synthase (glutamine-hydrolyzing) [Candidatus Sulfotelmatobacter sp.]|nr:asparagine synthase (glutamine-hydrolyzing) [Candidatus Sulfotelmatobacter sp.]